MKHKRNASLSTIVDDVINSLAEYARWPDTKAREATADENLAVLREALRGHDPVVPHSIMVRVLVDLLNDFHLRHLPRGGLRLAFEKLADLIDEQKSGGGTPK